MVGQSLGAGKPDRLCANLMNMIDRRTSEHEASQRDPEAGNPQEGERTHETAQPERGDEGSVQR